jgi:antitoxin component YwqK of YwqJK toxin-antitoxin module
MTVKIFITVLMVLCVLGFGQQSASSTNENQVEKKITYYEDGSKKTEGTYKNGQLEGPFVEYYPNGSKNMEGQFKNMVGTAVFYMTKSFGKPSSYKN